MKLQKVKQDESGEVWQVELTAKDREIILHALTANYMGYTVNAQNESKLAELIIKFENPA